MGINRRDSGAAVMAMVPIAIGITSLVMSAMYYGYRVYHDNRPDPNNEPLVSENSSFYCALSANHTTGGEDWSVIYRNVEGHSKVWLRMVRSMGKDARGEFNPYRRCQEIADRLNMFKDDGLMRFDYRADPSTPRQYVLCARTRLSPDNCPLVLTMMPEDDPHQTLREVAGALLPGNPESLQSSGPITPENPATISLEGQL